MSSDFEYSEHLGVDLPVRWDIKALKHISASDNRAFVDGPFGSDLKSNEYVDSGIPLIQLNNIRDGHHVLRNMKFITEEKKTTLERHIALPGDIVFAKMAEPVARTALVSSAYDEYVIVADCVKMTADPVLTNREYLVWVINSDCVRVNAELVSTGTTRIRISLGELKRLRIPFPPLTEQKKIAAFLDYETAKIDALIEKQQQLIALLGEKRQAVISHAVTKGLNPDVPMRDSGVEWLGEVPEHWVVCRIKQVAKRDSGHTPSKKVDSYWVDCDIPWVSLNDTGQLKKVDYINDTAVCVNQEGIENSSAHLLPKGCVVFTRDASIGLAAITRREMAVSQHLIAWNCHSEKLINEYLLLVFYAMEAELERFTFGATLKTIGLPDVDRLTAAFPCIEEQREIVSHTTKVRQRISASIAKSEQLLELLRERRTAIISAAVTGKIDVRNWKPPTDDKPQKPKKEAA